MKGPSIVIFSTARVVAVIIGIIIVYILFLTKKLKSKNPNVYCKPSLV
ncbi:hypothetical protein [Oceanobacillus oncorhynchi]